MYTHSTSNKIPVQDSGHGINMQVGFGWDYDEVLEIHKEEYTQTHTHTHHLP